VRQRLSFRTCSVAGFIVFNLLAVSAVEDAPVMDLLHLFQ